MSALRAIPQTEAKVSNVDRSGPRKSIAAKFVGPIALVALAGLSGATSARAQSTVTTVSTAAAAIAQGQSATFTARVSARGGGAPTGSINFSSSVNGSLGSATLEVYGGRGAIVGGDSHTCAIVNTGGVKCWGKNLDGQLGNSTNSGSFAANPAPLDVTGLSGAVALASGYYHTCALTSAGAVKCWGRNYSGQLGNSTGIGTSAANPVPADVAGLSGVVALAAGERHTCALTNVGTVKCWGNNSYGELGNSTGYGTNNAYPTPADVTDLSNVVALVAGSDFTCALTSSGSTKCWGVNDYGQLGNGTTSASYAPVDVSGVSAAVALAAGEHHACALSGTGAVKCWGYNRYGQLANGTNNGTGNPNSIPLEVGNLSGVMALAAGQNHTCALTDAGEIKCWGLNFSGQLGNGTGTQTVNAYPSPTGVAGLSGMVTLIAGTSHTCAQASDGAMTCWGTNFYGQLGNAVNNGVDSPNPTPANVAGVSAAINAKAAFTTSALAVGSHVITASYGGDGNHTASNGTVSQQVASPPAVTAIAPVTGSTSGGTTVTLTGTSLTGATAVTFGSTAAASFTVNSDTQIVATSPAGSGTVHITVTTPGGTSATSSADQFTYVSAPAPTVTGVSPSSGPTAGATVATVTGADFTGTTSVTFGGTAATSVTVISAAVITATTPAHSAGIVDVVVTTPAGTGTGANLYTYVVAPANDNFANATTVSGTSGTVNGSNVATTKESGEPRHAGNSGGASVWWKWTAPSSGAAVFTTAGSALDTVMGVYTGSAVNALTTIVSNDDENYPTITTSRVTFNAVGGTTYYVAVDGFNNATGAITLGWSFTSSGGGSLGVAASTNIVSLGPVGGAFYPSTFSYNLAASSGTVNWSISGVPDWLTASASSGSTSTSGTTVTFSVNTAALSKTAGAYGPTTITFTNTTNGQGNTTRTAGLTVSSTACEAMMKGPEFEGGVGAKGDILWRSDAGAIGIWFMNGTALSSGPGLGTVSTTWRIVATADFNGDGKSDLLWRNTSTGEAAIWFLSGVTVTGTASIVTIPTDWKIVGAADFNGDGKADLLWRQDSGAIGVWLLNNGAVQSTASLGVVPTTWRIVGLGDFNGDGKADFLWRASDGTTAVWLMNGTAVTSTGSLGVVPTDWRIAGVGDFNGDGKADILWRQNGGNVAMWFMNGALLSSSGTVGTIGSDWHIAATNDYNGDGKTDLLWRQDGGSLGIWLMNGATMTSAGGVAGIGTDWHIVNGEHDRPLVLIQPGPC